MTVTPSADKAPPTDVHCASACRLDQLKHKAAIYDLCFGVLHKTCSAAHSVSEVAPLQQVSGVSIVAPSLALSACSHLSRGPLYIQPVHVVSLSSSTTPTPTPLRQGCSVEPYGSLVSALQYIWPHIISTCNFTPTMCHPFALVLCNPHLSPLSRSPRSCGAAWLM
jgi:hypothetical protein